MKEPPAADLTKNFSPALLPEQDEPEKQFYHLLMQAPVAMVVFRGPYFVIEFANDLYFSLVGYSREALLNRPAFDVMQQAREQGFFDLLTRIRNSGECFRLNEHETLIERNGRMETVYLSIIHQPVKAPDGGADRMMVMITDVTQQVAARKQKEEETSLLQKTQAQLSLAINAGNIGIWSWDVRNNILTWSKEQCRLFGLQENEFTGKVEDFKRYVLPEDLENMYQEGEFAGEEARDYEYEFRIRRNDGAIRWLQARSRTVYNGEGQLIYITGVNIDITGQKLAEERLRQSEQRFSAAVEAVQGILWTNNADGQMEGLQPGWALLTGQSYQEYQGYGWSAAVHPDDAQPTLNAWNEAVHEQRTFVFEHRLKRKDGTWGRFSVRAIPVKQPDGTIREWVGVHTDITNQRRAEESLVESEKRFRTLAETLPQLVWMTDGAGQREYASHQWSAYTGLELVNDDTWEQIVHPADITPIMENWRHCLQTGTIYRAEVRLKNHRGDYRWHFVQGEPVYNEEGKIVRWIGAFTDIHDQKTASQKLEKLVAERTKELQRSNEDLQQFAHVASHDLKEPVRKIRTFGSRLSEEFGELLPGTAKLYLAKIESAAGRMYAMIDGVLTYSTLNAMQQPFERLELTKVVSDVENDLEVLIREKGATIVCEHLPSLSGAAILLYQLFYNLINNSLKFVRPEANPVVHISAQPLTAAEAAAKDLDADKMYTRIFVKDNGIGFEQENAGRIFQTFSRLNPKDRYEGTGLGLALCKKIAERHGGHIEAEGRLNEGATFIVTLPVS